MVFESNFNVDSVQYADIYNYPKEPKAKDSYGTAGWSSTTTGGSGQKPSQAEKKKSEKKKKNQQQGESENPAWGPVFQDRNHFTDMHCF